MSTDGERRTVQVDTPPKPYPVLIGPGLLDELGLRLREEVPAPRTLVVTDANVGPLYGQRALASLRQAGFECSMVTLPAGDATKSLESAGRLYDALAQARIDRASPVVSLGGGVVGDLTGFVAATWLRGVPFVQCSTTVEADVDAAVGGKTAVNHASGKNMIGAFYQPRFVLIDTDTLATLSERDYRAGLAESIKHAVIRDAAFFDWHEARAADLRARRLDCMPELIERNVRIKAAIVALDERETSGLRALLNFGHTVGHAIESAMARGGDPWRHGEAVAVGMVAACRISAAAGRLSPPEADRITNLVAAVGLPVAAPLAHARQEILTLMSADKKVAAGRLRFVLAEAIGRATLSADVRPEWIEAGLDHVLR